MKTSDSPVAPPPSRSPKRVHACRRALTLVEVLVAMAVLTITTLGILGAFVQSRRTTHFQKNQMLVESLVHGILEQLKSRSSATLLPVTIPRATTTAVTDNCFSSMADLLTYIGEGNTPPSVAVELDTDLANASTQLVLSPLPYIDPSAIPPGAIPADTAPGDGYGDINGDGVDDVGINTVFLDVKGTNGMDGSINDPTDDIRINLMIWIRDDNFSVDNSRSGGSTRMLSRGIYINYTWIHSDGLNTRRLVGSARGVSKPTQVAIP